MYQEHGALLESYAMDMANGDLGRAQDAVQEVLVRAWRHPEALDGRAAAPGGGCCERCATC